jgi:hypothetical protein
MNEDTYTSMMLIVAQVFEVIAAAVLFIGLLWSVWISVRDYRRRRDGGLAYRAMRQSFGGAILLGLERHRAWPYRPHSHIPELQPGDRDGRSPALAQGACQRCERHGEGGRCIQANSVKGKRGVHGVACIDA